MEKKITKREVINSMLTLDVIMSNEVYSNFLKHELELLDTKNANRKETPKQKENKELQNLILTILASNAGRTMTIKEIMETDELLKDLSTNKISAMLKVLIDGGSATRVKTNKGTFYTVAWCK